MDVANEYANHHAVSHPFRLRTEIGEEMVEFMKGAMPIVVLGFLLRSTFGKEVTDRARQINWVVIGFGLI